MKPDFSYGSTWEETNLALTVELRISVTRVTVLIHVIFYAFVLRAVVFGHHRYSSSKSNVLLSIVKRSLRAGSIACVFEI